MEQIAAPPVIEIYRTVSKRNQALVQENAAGLSQAQSLTPLWSGGSHFNWLVGHLTHSRCNLLRALGHDAPWSRERGARYEAGSLAPDEAEAESFETLLADFASTQASLEAALSQVTEADLERPRASGRGSVGRLLEFLVWHESYHCGQSTLYRRALGFDRVTP